MSVGADRIAACAEEVASARELRRMALINRRDLLLSRGARAWPPRQVARTAPQVGQNRAMRARHATLDDVDAVVTLAHSAYRGETSRAGWTTEADLLDGGRTDAPMVRGLIEAECSVVLVIDDTSEPGALLACCHLERRPESAYLGLFAVRPGMQGRGVGTTMLAAAEALAREWGVSRLELTVLNHRPELLAWYERLGFAMTGHDTPFPYGDERFGIPRRPDLVLQGMAKRILPDED
jgi:GNAT superfamily N-acetyltransferase